MSNGLFSSHRFGKGSSIHAKGTRKQKREEESDRYLIPHVDQTPEQKRQFSEIMAKGNVVLKRLAASAKKLYKQLNGEVLSKAKFRAELFKTLNGIAKDCVVYGVPVTAAESSDLLAVKRIEGSMLSGYSKLIYKAAVRWHKLKKQTDARSLGFDDLYNEAAMRAVECIYGYTDPNIRFSTYVTHAINRRLMQVINDANPLSGWSNAAKKLFGNYQKAQRKMNGPVSFEELCDMLKLTPAQRKSLAAMTTKVINHSDYTPTSSEGNDEFDLFANLEGGKASARLDHDMRQAIANARLSTWESAVLAAFMDAPWGSEGWKTEVARKFVNPATGERYSRAAPAIALDRAIRKIRSLYEGEAAAA